VGRRRVEFVASIDVLAEYRRVAEGLHKEFSSIDIKAILDLITRETRIVEPVPKSACDDQSDLKFLACALAADARIVVTWRWPHNETVRS